MEDGLKAWNLAAIRIQGLRLMRPERSWRPIVTVEVDKHDAYEFHMGCDGQNPNIKELFRFRNASHTSLLDIKVWYQSQTKKKRKKRHLVAVATHCLGELLKRQEVERQLDIRLQCESKHAKASMRKSQSGTSFQIRLRPPSEKLDHAPNAPDVNHGAERVPPLLEDGYGSESSTSSSSSDTLNDPPSPASEVSQVAQSGLRRRRIRGYAIFSEDELLSEEYISDFADDSTTQVPSASSGWNDKDGKLNDELPSLSVHEEVLSVCRREIHLGDAAWIAPSVLPQHVQELTLPSTMNFAEEILASFTAYREMKEATGDSQFEKIFGRFQQEWTYVGGLLVALAALNTGAFSLSRNSLFHVDEWCQCAIAASSISTGLGIACDTWFLFRYNWADLGTFRSRTKDLFDSYFFFCLSARVPALCMLLSGLSLMLFLGLVAYDAWPQAVLVISFFIGFMMTLQFLAYSAHWCAIKIMQGGRVGSRHVVTIVQSIRKT